MCLSGDVRVAVSLAPTVPRVALRDLASPASLVVVSAADGSRRLAAASVLRCEEPCEMKGYRVLGMDGAVSWNQSVGVPPSRKWDVLPHCKEAAAARCRGCGLAGRAYGTNPHCTRCNPFPQGPGRRHTRRFATFKPSHMRHTSTPGLAGQDMNGVFAVKLHDGRLAATHALDVGRDVVAQTLLGGGAPAGWCLQTVKDVAHRAEHRGVL